MELKLYCDQPHPPIFIGNNRERDEAQARLTLKQVVEMFDAMPWMEYQTVIEQLRQEASK